MRVMMGRGDWRPGVRIESLRRYAFLGDSNVYGHGVAPDQTLSAYAERQMNELLPGWPVEAVNLGVCGYNLWNSWLAFKHGPQVYDGVVLGLCNNDSELFGRTYNAAYSEPAQTRWEHTHPFASAVTSCFDDIASFSRERSLPVAVVHFNAFQAEGMLRIGQIIGDLCASRGLCFIDTFSCYRERNFAFTDVVVSSADVHPSAMAHEAVGRHLVALLRRQGWFREYEASAIVAAPGRILAATRAMIETDHYPPDVALHWALHTLDAKSRLARRMQTSANDFSTAAAQAGHELTRACHRWHTTNRIRALAGQVVTTEYGLVPLLFHAQAERLKVEELGFVLGVGDWSRLTSRLVDAEPPQQIAPDIWPADAQSFLEKCVQEVLRLRDALDVVRSSNVPAAFVSPHDDASMLTDLEHLSRLADRIEEECTALKAEFLRTENVFSGVRPTLSEAENIQVSRLIDDSLKRLKQAFRLVPQLCASIKRIHEEDHAPFTSVEVTISGAMEGKPLCLLAGSIEYAVPSRLPCADVGVFWLDGSVNVVKLRFPLLYAGRLILRPPFRHGPIEVPDQTNLIKIEVYNRPNRRQIVEPTWLYKDRNGYLVSPSLYLLC
jgi:hypothetical protein